MTERKKYMIVITIGPFRFYGNNQLREAQQLAGNLRELVGRALSMKGRRNSKSLRVDVREQESS